MSPDDARLVARALVDRDRAAFDALVRRHQSRVRGWLRQLARDAALADDLAQETFMRAWHKLSHYSGRGSFEAWLFSIARNEFRMHLRRAGRDRDKLSAATLEARVGCEAQTGQPAAHQVDLDSYLAILGADERDALVLAHGFGMSHSEISDVTGLPLGTVKSHLRRGVAKIRAAFRLGAEDG